MMQRKRVKAAILAFLSIILLIHMIPLIVVILNSIRPNAEIVVQLIGMPSKLFLHNYSYVWKMGQYFRGYINTFIIGLSCVAIVTVVCGLAAYAIAKARIYFAKAFLAYFTIALSIPHFSVLVPLYFLFQKVKLVNSHLGIILILSAFEIPFTFLFMNAFFSGVPTSFFEAARIDGSSELQTLWYVVVPLSKVIFMTMGIIVFVHVWNEFLFSNTFLQTPELRTVSLRFFSFVGQWQVNYGQVYAASIITIVPLVVLYFLTQKMFIEGITLGGIKG